MDGFDETRLKRECVGAVHILCRCQSPGKIRLTVWQEWFLSLPIVQELPSQSEMVLPDPDQNGQDVLFNSVLSK